MKRFWLVLLSLGLIMAFSASAFAVDVKVSGEYDIAGVYLNKIAVDNGFEGWAGDVGSHNPSTAFYYQRLRIGTDFIVAPCLKLVTQFDAMDRIWGGPRGDASITSGNNGGTAGTREESQNFVMNLAYIEYTSPIGLFKVGYQNDFVFGTVFGDRAHGQTSGQIQYFLPVGPVMLFAGLAKEADLSASAVTASSVTDKDFDSYRIAAIYGLGKKIEGGALLLYNRSALAKDAGYPDGYLANVFNLVPYFKAQIGPVALQGELNYGFGKLKYEDNALGRDMSVDTLSVFLDATANLGMVYVGGSFAYVSGQDYTKTDKIQSGLGNTGGLDWNPCLILFNTDLDYWAGDIVGHSYSVVNGEMANAWFFQGRVGVKPTPQLDAMLSVSYATVDKKTVPYEFMSVSWYAPTTGSSYGVEVDLTGTYKITNNLSYMLGAGYLFTGDYFKGVNQPPLVPSSFGSAKVQDEFIVINKLTLSF
jgi:hypothetical protein